MSRTLTLHKRAAKFLGHLPEAGRHRIMARLCSLVSDPYPLGHRKIQGRDDTYRVRVGSWRIVYVVSETTVFVSRIDHRKDVYRDL